MAKSAPTRTGPTEATLTNVLTAEGMIVGTRQYMGPEQFEGKEAHAHSDIWAFGAVLYEMLTGRKVFEGKTMRAGVSPDGNRFVLMQADALAAPPVITVVENWFEAFRNRK